MAAQDEPSVEDRLAALQKACDDRAAALDKRIADQEQNWTRLKWAVGLLGTAVLLVTGVGFIQIPEAAKKKAIEEVTPIAKDAAKKEVELLVPKTIIQELEGYKGRAAKAATDAEQSRDKVLEIEMQISGNVVDSLRKEIAGVQASIQSRSGIAFKVSQPVTLDDDARAGAYLITYSLKKNGNLNCTDLVVISPKDPSVHPHNPPHVSSARYNDEKNATQIMAVEYGVTAGSGGRFNLVATVRSFGADTQTWDGTARYTRLPTPR